MTTTVTPYLSFAGNAREAFGFYAQALGGQIETMMTFADMPAPPPGAEGSGEGCGDGAQPFKPDGIMHAALRLPGGAMVFGADVPPGMPFDGIRGMMIALQLDGNDEARQVFDALGQGGQVTMPLAPTFWAEVFGMVTDRYGVSWGISGKAVQFQR